jgi:hypothetical protein
MPAWAALLGTLGYNYRRHLHGRPTICATFRRYVPRWAVVPLWSAFTAWIVPHLLRGYRRH